MEAAILKQEFVPAKQLGLEKIARKKIGKKIVLETNLINITF